MTSKFCYSCAEEKPLTEYHKHRGRRDARSSICKSCHSKRMALLDYKCDDEKVCNKCKTLKPSSEFYKNNKTRTGLFSSCIECYNAIQASYRNRPDVKAARSQWFKDYIKTPEYTLRKTRFSAVKRRPSADAATLQQLMELFEKQKGLCAVSGIKMTYAKGSLLPTTISLDRIDNTKNYSIDNVRLVCLQVNLFKNRWSDDHMMHLARSIVLNNTEVLPYAC